MSTGGLGRGLSTILTGPSAAPQPSGSIAEQLIETAHAAMAATGPLRLCGHLADPLGDAALTLRSPDLASLHPTEAYQLFTALGAVDATAVGRHDLDIGAHRAMAIAMQAGGRHCLWFFGDDRLDDVAVERLAGIAETYGPAVCNHGPTAPADQITLVSCDQRDGGTIEVEVTVDGAPGTGRDATAELAAGAAVLEATGLGASVTQSAMLVDHNGDRAVLIGVRTGAHHRCGVATVEAAPPDGDALALAAATATRRAVLLSG